MKDNKTDAENALVPDDSAVSSERTQKELIQRGQVDIHTHQTAAKHLKDGADALNARNYPKAIEAFQLVIQHKQRVGRGTFPSRLGTFYAR